MPCCAQVVVAALVLADCTSFMPTDPHQKADPILQVCLSTSHTTQVYAWTTAEGPACMHALRQVWLQQFAWTEDAKPGRLAERGEHTRDPGAAEQLQREPMFCFETALKALYWSTLVYRYDESAPDLTRDKPPSVRATLCPPPLLHACLGGAHQLYHMAMQEDGSEGVRAVRPRFTPAAGMAMCGLEQVQLFWERSLDTKVLIGWSDSAIVVSFRGTASLRNALADLQARACCPCMCATLLPICSIFEELPIPRQRGAAAACRPGVWHTRRCAGGGTWRRVLLCITASTAAGQPPGSTGARPHPFSLAQDCSLLTTYALQWFTLPAHHLHGQEECVPLHKLEVLGLSTVSWRAVCRRVITHIQSIVAASGLKPSSVRVLLTGHSLGGAVACLAAHDLVTQCGLTSCSVYTFGAPRPGNRAFRKEYNSLVPATWAIINDAVWAACPDAVGLQQDVTAKCKCPGRKHCLSL